MIYLWDGAQYKGAMKERRKLKRKEAESRNRNTPHGRRAACHRGTCGCKNSGRGTT